MTKPTLKKLREEIDAIDLEILRLLNKRAKVVIDVGRAKTRGKQEYYVPERELEIYRRLTQKNTGPFPSGAVKNVFREVISACLALEKPLKIAFLGPVATFTHQACMQHFGLSGEFIAKKDIADVFLDVESGRAEFGVVPVENTSEGVVSHTLDMFVSSELKICAEIMLEVTLALLNKGGKLEGIRKVCSHPHAIAQCKDWIKNNLPKALVFDVSSTAMAAKLASEDPDVAAIASAAAASLYDLRVIERNIEDHPHNFTRFLVIGRKETSRTGGDKTSLVFAIKDAPGALYSMLQPFAERGLNLTKIESRPIKTKAWEYLFYIDFDGHITDANVKAAVDELSEHCAFLKVLGSYPKSS
ncbi:MAG: prephenate dehydratase [Thermodesulfobacteriota bacterium]